MDANTISRHIEIPTIYLQVKTIRNNPTNKNNTMTNDINFPITLLSTPATQKSNHSNDVISIDQTHSTTTTHSSTTNQTRSTTEQPISIVVYKNVATARNLNNVYMYIYFSILKKT